MIDRARARGGDLIDAIEAEAEKFASVIGQVYTAAGLMEVASLGFKLGLDHLRFDPTHPGTAQVMAQAKRKFLLNFSRAQRMVIHQVQTRPSGITTVIHKARSPFASDSIRDADALGLTPYQERIVQNYRAGLAAGSRDALERILRDRRFDATVERAVDGETVLTWPQIDRMTQRYRQRWIAYRAKTIARTQALTAVNSGRQAAFKQVAEQANFDPRTIIRTWNATMDERTRDSHAALDGAEVDGMDTPFVSDHGPLMYPGDPAGDPAEIINCRCWLTYDLPEQYRGF